MKGQNKKPAGQLGAVVLMIGTMSLGLAVGLGALKFWDKVNEMVFSWWQGLGGGMRPVPTWVEMIFAVVMAYLPVAVMLHSPTMWRRSLLWLGLLGLCAAWVPVMALAAWSLPPILPIVAGFWSGLCALIFSYQHVLPCELLSTQDQVEKKVVREIEVKKEG